MHALKNRVVEMEAERATLVRSIDEANANAPTALVQALESLTRASNHVAKLEAALRAVTLRKCHAPVDFLRVCQCCEDVHAVLLPVPIPQPSPSVSDAKMLEGADARAPEVEAPVETGDSTVGEAGASAGLRSSEALQVGDTVTMTSAAPQHLVHRIGVVRELRDSQVRVEIDGLNVDPWLYHESVIRIPQRPNEAPQNFHDVPTDDDESEEHHGAMQCLADAGYNEAQPPTKLRAIIECASDIVALVEDNMPLAVADTVRERIEARLEAMLSTGVRSKEAPPVGALTARIRAQQTSGDTCETCGDVPCDHFRKAMDLLSVEIALLRSAVEQRVQEAKPVGEGLPYAEQSGEWRAGYDEAAAVAHAEQRDLRRQLRECSDKAPTKADLDAVYDERDKCVALIAAMAKRLGWKVGLAEHPPDPSWDPAWRTIVFVDLPAGQVSWHIHDRERSWFAPLPDYDGAWDGHSTPLKYVRVLASALNHRSDTPTAEPCAKCEATSKALFALDNAVVQAEDPKDLYDEVRATIARLRLP